VKKQLNAEFFGPEAIAPEPGISYNALVMNVDDLPDDPVVLKALLLKQLAERETQLTALAQRDAKLAEQIRQCEALQLELLRAKHELLRMQRWYYGRRADRLSEPEQIAQPLFDFAKQVESLPEPQVEDVEAIADDATPVDLREVELKTVRRVRRGRRNLAEFDKLPVMRREHDLGEDQKTCPCCNQPRVKIGEESSWQIEYVPGHFERIEHVRFKYACSHCEADAQNPQITLADKPRQPIDKGLPGPGLLSFVATSKFCDYLPLYRLEDLFERSGFSIGRATMSVWCRDMAGLLRPLYDRMVWRVLGSHVICTDDTTMPMLCPGAGKTRTARMWVYVGDEDNPYDVFDFTLSRNRDGPNRFLKGFRQTLMADGYGGYDGVVVASGITRAGCWAHARRKFVDAEKSGPQIAKEAVELIGRLYAIERQAKDLPIDDRTRLRAAQSVPILDQLHQRLSLWKLELLPKHPMSEAVGYTLNQWTELNVFARDGAVPIDNNISEREMKRIVLNRKNSLFVGNERGGETAAILSSLTSTCRRHEIDPQRYLTQLLTNLPDTPMSELDRWLPDQWRATHRDPMPVAGV
jgi:transposase